MSIYSLEQKHMLSDTWRSAKKAGYEIKLKLRTEDIITKDKYGSIIGKSSEITKTYYAHPMSFSPSQREIDKTGIKETVDALAYIPMKFFIDDGYTTGDNINILDMIRDEVITSDGNYIIKDKVLDTPISKIFQYIILGLRKS